MDTNKSDDVIKFFYLGTKRKIKVFLGDITQYFRRIIRFVALPYCYFKLVNWDECKVSRWQVARDFLYIFFKLKYFPDNYSRCRLWDKNRSEWCYYYGSIYNPYPRMRLRREVQKSEYEILFIDKNICYQLCSAEGLPLPEQYDCIENNCDFKNRITSILKKNPEARLIVKPLRGKGGQGILLAFRKNDKTVLMEDNAIFSLDEYFVTGPVVIQRYIKQHEKLSKLSPSVNSVRVVTLFTRDNSVEIIGAYMRFGVNDSYVDNVCSGGIAVGIDIHNGYLNEFGYDAIERIIYSHPTSRISLNKFQIPFWQEVKELAIKIQKAFFYYKLLGCDIAITSDGPVIIEINAMPDFVGLEQKCGPVLRNDRIRKEFMEYNLLINKLSQNL